MFPIATFDRLRTRWSSWTPERYPRVAKGKHAALVFVICLVAFVAYRVTAVPLIEPDEQDRPHQHVVNADPNLPALEEQRRRLAVYFKEGDWELDNAKVLETSQGMLILKDYKTLGDGRVELKPCTVLLLPEGHDSLSDEEKARRAVVMRAPNGARLQFEEFNIRMARVGKLIGGDLDGEIVIHSQQRDPGPEDDLLIRTRDVVMADNAIHSESQVEFRLGSSFGSGREMWMDLVPNNSGDAKAGPSFGGIRGFSLKRDVKLHLAVDSLKKPEDGAATAKEPQPPIEVSSRGPFKFDMQSYVASFVDHVDVLRIAPSGPSDQLLCEELFVHFVPKVNADGTSETPKPGKAPKLEPGWIRAFGNPVVITAPSSKATAFGEELAYDLRKRNGALKALRPGEQVKVTYEQNEIHARELHFSPGATKADLGSFLAVGPGWLKGTRPEDPDAPIEARWSDQALLRPEKGEHVLSVTGRAFIKSATSGSLAADAIHAWLRPGEPLPDGKKGQPTPRRVHALGAVEFTASQIDGHVQQLDAYFEKAPAEVPVAAQPAVHEQANAAPTEIQPSVYVQTARKEETAAPSMSPYPTTSAAPVGPSLLPGAASNKPPTQRFDVKGGRLRLQIAMEEPQPRLAGLVLEQDVEIVEIPIARPDDKPLILRGDRVDLTQPAPQHAEVKIVGRPAHLEARGLTLDSAQINMDQAANRMWTSGAGQMDVLVDRDLEGQELATPKPLKVTWRGDMEFDGLEARFHEGVEASQNRQELHTKQLAVVMRQRVDFQKGMGGDAALGGSSGGQSPQVGFLRCQGGVALHQYTYNGPELTSFREMRTRDLTIDQQTGEITAHGPGTVESAQLGSGNPLLEMSATATPAAPTPTAGAPPEKEQINYLRVDFAEIIKGNMKSKELTFHEAVRTIYGPVPDWRAKLDPQFPAFTNEDIFSLTTDALTVRQAVLQTNNRSTIELEADGDTKIEAQKFRAWSSHLTYDQSKELMTLHGDAYTDATIWHVAKIGELEKETRAGTIFYSKKNQSVTVGDFKHLDLSGLVQPKPKKK
jgi:hypothetical protein